MAKFIDDSSPCLNLVTVFLQDKIIQNEDDYDDYEEEIFMFLFLKQVRRHVEHVYKL
jgi:hypothetical protein